MKKLINLLLIGLIFLSLIVTESNATAGGTIFSISGRVTDRLGNPVSGADVTLMDSTYKIIKTGKTDDTGHFDFLNVVADTDTCTVQFSYTDSNGVKYELPAPYNHAGFYNTKNIQTIPDKEMVLTNYPPPIYGYVHGVIQTSMTSSAQFVDGIVYLQSLDTGVKYYEFAEITDNNRGGFQFYAPAGTYMLYAQHWENDKAYESSPQQVTIKPNAELFEVQEILIILPLNSPAANADPPSKPGHNVNDVNGTVVTRDGKPWPDATVTLLQSADNKTGWVPIKGSDSRPLTATTDANGYYDFYAVSPTADDGRAIQAAKAVKVMVEYTDPSGNRQTYTTDNQGTLYYPDVIGAYGMENVYRNIMIPVTLPFSVGGWVNINSAPSGASIYADGSQLLDGNNNPLLTPQTVYLDPGPHTITIRKDGYQDYSDSVTIEANKQASDFSVPLQKALLPSWVAPVTAVIILIIGIILLVVLLSTRIKSIMAFGGKISRGAGQRNSNVDRAVPKAETAEQKILERQRKAEEKMAARRESLNLPEAKDDVQAVNLDPVRRKREVLHEVYEDEGRKPYASPKKKTLDFDLKHVAEGAPKKVKPREEAKTERSPVVFANEIYKRPEADVERIPYEPSSRQAIDEREALVERPTVPERDERFRVPRMSAQREASTSRGDKERVLKYIREHQDGVSFIQMSNDLEIIPNNLTYITKELVINDDIEKVKGLYYYKSHAMPVDDKSSSVVVWRLDGDK